MEEKNMTALICCFSRMYHYKNNECRIFSDTYAEKILTQQEYENISNNMKGGINFFNPNFEGDSNEALRWIVDNQLSPSVLGRSAYTEKSLERAIKIGTKQYLIFASGYDTYAYRNKEAIDVFEIDRKEILDYKKKRLLNNNIDISKANYIECDLIKNNWTEDILNSKYDKNKISFCSLLGISYYLTNEQFENMVKQISEIVCDGSSIIFDYPTYDESKVTKTNEQLASASNEEMQSKYNYEDIEKILSNNGFLIYEHLNNTDMTNQYFSTYNTFNPNNIMVAPVGVSYCLAVKKSVL